MSKSWKEKSVLSLRKKLMVQVLSLILIMSTLGLVVIVRWDQQQPTSVQSQNLDFLGPRMAPYQASAGILDGQGGKFGLSLAYAGDVNDDGKDDIIIGAPEYDNNKGRVYIYFGGATPSSPSVTITGGSSGDKFGKSVSGAGRYNNDDIDDIVIGAPGAGSSDEGKIYIFNGRSDWTGIDSASGRNYEATGENSGDKFGNSVSSAGDIYGDGYDGILVGAYAYSSDTGRAYLFRGNDPDMSDWDKTWTGSASGDHFGISVSSAGNVDGGNYDDIIIGAHKASSQYGQAYIYFGSSTGPSTLASVTITGESSGSKFGSSVSDAGNVNGDSYDDVIIGSYGAGSYGKAYIFYGRSTASWVSSSPYSASSADVILVGEYDPSNVAFGGSVSSAGDYNNDNYDDVIVGSPYESSISGEMYEEVGRAHIFFGGSTMDSKVDVSMTGEADGDYFGTRVSNAGDFDDDGYDDVVVGAPYYDGPGQDYGRAYLYNFVDYVEDTKGGTLGYSVSSAGKYNNDNCDDVVVGDPYYELSSVPWGKAYVYHGGSTMDSTPDVYLSSPQSNSEFGFSVASGDFNNDGYGDILVGAPRWDDGQNVDVGRVYIYFGNDGSPSTENVVITGENAGDLFGYSVSSAGKWHGASGIHNDDYEDVLVGAPGYNSNQGRAYLFYGSSHMSSQISAGSASVTFSAHNNDEKFGFSVSSAGNFDNDQENADDILIGSPLFNSGNNDDAGRVYLYLGQDLSPSTDDATFTGESAGDNFGHSVSSAGDMDNDNYDDIIIGAPKYGNGDKGKAYVFEGKDSPSGDTGAGNANLKITGQSDGDEFGYSVSSAGNVNNDNYDDIVVGAPKNDAGGTNAGRVYTFYGSSSLNDWDELFVTGVYANNAGEKKGWSVSGAGDVNNDNYDDVIIGAPYRMGTVSLSPEGRIEIWGDPS